MTTEKKAEATDTEALLSEARARFHACEEWESQFRQEQIDDLKFYRSDQWDDAIKTARMADKRPCLTINRIAGGVKQATNEQRKSPPSIQVNPVDSGADPETAEVFQGIIRNIETQSEAAIAYETAGESQARIGLGYFWLKTEYVGPDSFNQKICIERVRNRFSVYLDPAAEKFDKSDARYGFITADIPKEEFSRRWPKARANAEASFTALGDYRDDWFSEETVRIANYYYVKVEADELGLFLDAPNSEPREVLKSKGWPKGLQPLRTRATERKTVHWCLISGVDKLESADLPGTRIPIIPVVGEELIDESGRVDYRGLIRDAKDPQRLFNATESATAEQIALGPRSPWVMAEGQDEGHAEWKTANARNWSRLVYNPKTHEGHLVPPPQRNSIEPPIQATVLASQRFENHLRAVLGFVDLHGEEQRPEQSGRAILARQQQMETGNLNYLDNLGRAVRSCGRLLLEWIPVIYDVPQIVRILGLDEQPKMVMVHAGKPPNLPEGMDEEAFKKQQGIEGIYDLSVGQYDVSISVGPSYQSKRQESVDAMVEFVRAYPAAFPVIGDLLVGNMDWAGARQVSERLKKMLPPNLKDEQEGPDPAQLQQQLGQAEQMIAALTEQLNGAKDAIQNQSVQAASKERIASDDRASKERIEFFKVQADLLKTEAQMQHEQAMLKIQAMLNELQQAIEHSHQRVMSEQTAIQDRETAAMEAAEAGTQGDTT